MLKEIIDKKLFSLRGVVGLFPANSVGDDVEIYNNEDRDSVHAKFCMLRQQKENEVKDEPYRCLLDFIAPKKTGIKDYMGMFAVACFGLEEQVAIYEAKTDIY